MFSILNFRMGALAAVAIAFLFGNVTPAHAEPTLVRAVLHTHTKNEDRDHDTGIFVEVTERDGHTDLAKIGNALACCGQFGYGDNTNNDLDIPLEKPGILKSACQGFKFRMGILAAGGIFGKDTFTGEIQGWKIFSVSGGNDTWKFDAWLTLYFSDGSNLQSNKLDQTLSSQGGKMAWDNLQ